jgi:hypothetical protein
MLKAFRFPILWALKKVFPFLNIVDHCATEEGKTTVYVKPHEELANFSPKNFL